MKEFQRLIAVQGLPSYVPSQADAALKCADVALVLVWQVQACQCVKSSRWYA